MGKSTKAVLLSTLVLPGAGHFFLKKHISGAILACASLVSLYLIIANMLERAQEIADQILQGQIAPDVATITELLSSQAPGKEAQLLDIAWAVLIMSWIIGIFDSYRCSRRA